MQTPYRKKQITLSQTYRRRLFSMIPTFNEFVETQTPDYLIEGGNVQIGAHEAQRIDLNTISRDAIVPVLSDALAEISMRFEEMTGFPLWSKTVMQTLQHLSGSALHFFNIKEIDSKTFAAVKNSVGDIDTQVDGDLQAPLVKFLETQIGQVFGDLEYIGFKKSPAQLISLWKSKQFGINIQIDFELVGYQNGQPTPWATFSHSSHWDDLQAGIKGVFQKYLFRAITHLSSTKILVLPKSARGKEKILDTNLIGFSVDKGLRNKYGPVMVGNKQELRDGIPVYRELETSNSDYVTDQDLLYRTLFGRPGSPQDVETLQSFVGMVGQIGKIFPTQTQDQIIDAFANLLWGKGAQGLVRGSGLDDMKSKRTAFEYLIEKIGSRKFSYYESLIATYYENY